MKNKKIIILILVLLLAAFLRLYKLDQIPAALNWDEVDAGYNAYAIANWGRDEWGETLPLVFTSFRDDKHPVHIYSAVPFIKIFGLSDFVTRLPSAILGVLSVLIIFYLSKLLFNSYLSGILAALFLAISPYHIHFSRGLWESNFALSFFLLGLLLFHLGLQNNSKLLITSSLSFGLSLFSYHSSKVVLPPLLFLMILLNLKSLIRKGINFYIALTVLIVFFIILFLNPRLLGTARVEQTKPSDELIFKTEAYKVTKNSYLGMMELAADRYFSYFSMDYLFILGDQSPRNSVKVFGEFYKIDALFIFIGIISLLLLKSRVSLLVLAWLLIAPLPASLSSETPNANRAIFMLGSMILISSYGASNIIKWFKGRFRYGILIIILAIVSFESLPFINYYFNVYPKKDPHDWVYGMKQIVEYVKDNNDKYDQVFMTDARSQPYTFFLYYLKFPVTDYLRRAYYNNGESKSYNTVSNFDKYYFGGWDTVESMPQSRVLYILTPSQYDGLRHKMEFDVKKLVNFPDGATAFFIISSK